MKTIDDIKFIEHGGKHGKTLGLFMPGRYWVSEPEIVLTWKIAIAHLDTIDWMKKVCTETIFTEDIWRQFEKPVKFSFGRALKYFCTHEMLPIEVANPGKKGKRFYKMKE